MSNSPEGVAPLDYLAEAKATLDTVVLSHREPASEVIALAQAQATIGLLEELRGASNEHKIAAKAWEEGWNACVEYMNGPDWGQTLPNPYRADRIEQGPGE